MLYAIQENVFREQHYYLLEESLNRMQLPYDKVRIFPFIDKIVNLNDIPDGSYNVDDLPTYNPNRKDIFVFGAIKLARIAKDNGWYPGSLMNDNHDYLVYKDFYKENLLNYDSEIKEFAEDFKWYKGEAKFIRPCKDSKVFTGKVFNEYDWKDYVENALHNGHHTMLDAKTEIQVSIPKVIQKEIRFWVVGGKVITGSQYRLGNQMVLDEYYEDDAFEFAQKMVDLFQLADAFVIDVCLVNGEWKIVECGNINACGFYKSNIAKMLDAVENHFEPCSANP